MQKPSKIIVLVIGLECKGAVRIQSVIIAVDLLRYTLTLAAESPSGGHLI